MLIVRWGYPASISENIIEIENVTEQKGLALLTVSQMNRKNLNLYPGVIMLRDLIHW